MIRDEAYFAKWLAVEIAPTIRGSKPSTILTFIDTKTEAWLALWREYGAEALQGTVIQFMTLHWSPGRETVLFYRPELLEQCLAFCPHRYFLQKLGYPVADGLNGCLETLRQRFQQCCPHEIGIILGIPIKDVLGFMGLAKLPLTCRREWCVYGDPTESLAMMDKFASDRMLVTGLLDQGLAATAVLCCTADDLLQAG